MKILVTGAAGFIGFHLCKKLLLAGHKVFGLDNLNDYYDPLLKIDRLKELGIFASQSSSLNTSLISEKYKGFYFLRSDLQDADNLRILFSKNKFEIVINLAAQAGVRYSFINPDAYIKSNIIGFQNLLECCRHFPVQHLIFASSSSVYGQNDKIPFSENDSVDHPISVYAATKKSNELFAYTYSHLYNLKCTGLRFFTVYGPWSRPDMACYLFTKAIFESKEIHLFNNGELYRDFTYIDDIVEGIMNVVSKPLRSDALGYAIYNIGNNKPIQVLEFVRLLEEITGIEAIKKMLPMQQGDVYQTYADISKIQRDYNFIPATNIKEGLINFIEWYKNYYNIR